MSLDVEKIMRKSYRGSFWRTVFVYRSYHACHMLT